ncbi:MAG TPA: hypothetical protein VMW17_04270 [Candidatus Binatia bacterium]|nr:hypothetical protein [Candidatus Binatia bacterium]
MSPPPSAVGLLPHAFPFLLIDRILMIEPGRWAAAVKNVTRNEPMVNDRSELPAVILAEVMAQTAGLAAAPSPTSPTPAVLAKLDRFRCRSIAVGDQLLAIARVVRRLGAAVSVHACVLVDQRPRAATELVLHFAPASAGSPR